MSEKIPKTMRAIEIAEAGGPEVLRVREFPVPEPGDGEVLIKVSAAGVNRPDVMQRLGLYPPPPGAPDIPGLEVAGTVVTLGANASGVQEGDAVCALVIGGGYAEYCVTPASLCLPIPENLSAVQAAAIPETFFTVWTNVFDRGRLAGGETLLVHGGSSGIGRHGGNAGRERERCAGGRCRVRVGHRRRLCRVLRDAGITVPADPREFERGAGGRHSRNIFHRLDQRLRSRTPRGR